MDEDEKKEAWAEYDREKTNPYAYNMAVPEPNMDNLNLNAYQQSIIGKLIFPI